MCGFFLLASTSKESLAQGLRKQEAISQTITPRGPDALSIYAQDGLLAMHTHLRITGYQAQPLLFSDGVALYNGEIYNEYEKIAQNIKYSDASTLLDILECEGVDGVAALDGEFAICVYSPRNRTVSIATDCFGTKPVYYSARPGQVAVGSYNDTILAYDITLNVIRVPSNTLLVIDVETGRLLRSITLWHFDFSNQTECTYDKWIEAFAISIKKRTSSFGQRYYVPLSSGYDSGLIASFLMDMSVDFKCYSVPYLEETNIIDKRVQILHRKGIETHLLQISVEQYQAMHEYLKSNLGYYPLIAEDFEVRNFPDPDFRNVPGYVAAAIICQNARLDQRLIQLSGQGADEILTDYSTGSMKMSEIKGNWDNVISPWKNLHQGWNAVFLGGTERISGLFGIETRYPFLDRELVQSFINIKPKLKSVTFKGPIAKYFDLIKFPYIEQKQGFAGFDVSKLT